MKNVIKTAKTIGVWFFVAFCLILALGSGGGAGSALMLVVAVIAMPIKLFRNLWNKILGINSAVAPPNDNNARWWELAKKKEQKRQRTAFAEQKSRKALKPISIAIIFIIAFCLCMAQIEPSPNEDTPSLDTPPVVDEMVKPDEDPAAPTEPPAETTYPEDDTDSLKQPDENTTTESPTPSDEDPEIENPTETPRPPEPLDSQPTSEPEPIPADSTFSIHYIDVGQADAALIECDGHYMLIDGGNKADSNVIYSVLKKAAVNKLDIVVGTHAHEDHIGGLPGAYNYTTADLTLCPVTRYDSDAFDDFKTYANKNGGGITIPSVGDKYQLGSATVEILGLNGGNDANNSSIVLMITYGNTRFLFTGDAEREAEQVILSNNVDLAATVLKVGHHGSDTSTTYPFLREVMPEYAIISAGEGNSYGHPTDDTLSRLRDADVTVYRTDLNGDIYLTSDGQSVYISSDKTVSQEDILMPGGSYAAPDVTEPDNDDNTPTSGTDYVVNTNTGKFHYPSCSSVKKMKESNKLFYTGTRDELISKGYSPCGNCHP